MMRRFATALCAALLASSCQEPDDAKPESASATSGSKSASKTDAAGRAESVLDAGNAAAPAPDASELATPVSMQDAGGPAQVRSDASAPGLVGSGLPCDVAQVVSKHCVSCHGQVPMAPMPLVSQEQFAASTPRDPSQRVYQRVQQRIHDDKNPMPPRSALDQPSADELAVLDAWLGAGAPKSSEDCMVVAADAGADELPFDPSECEYQVDVHAWGGASDDGAPFKVPAGQEIYQCFTVAIPWDVPVHGIRFEPLIDNSRVLHHLNLATVPEDVEPGSAPGKCIWESQTAVTGWSPGVGTTVWPPDIGLRIADNTEQIFQLEMHYSNVSGNEDAYDRSGARICATTKLRKNEASDVALGSVCLGPLCAGIPPGKSEVTSTCVNLSNSGPAHVLWTSPHMHSRGRHLKTEITRTDGTTEILTDADFDFNFQLGYESDKLIYPGDVLTTTCTFENDTNKYIPYGETSNEEMCFNFLMFYPPDSISNISRFCGL